MMAAAESSHVIVHQHEFTHVVNVPGIVWIGAALAIFVSVLLLIIWLRRRRRTNV